jgi:hypothetical protein
VNADNALEIRVGDALDHAGNDRENPDVGAGLLDMFYILVVKLLIVGTAQPRT